VTEPIVAQKGPYRVEVKAGKTYFWCACGRSKSQPFCDGSHNGTDFTPLVYRAQDSARLFFCGCKASSAKPLCDGTHSKL